MVGGSTARRTTKSAMTRAKHVTTPLRCSFAHIIRPRGIQTFTDEEILQRPCIKKKVADHLDKKWSTLFCYWWKVVDTFYQYLMNITNLLSKSMLATNMCRRFFEYWKNVLTLFVNQSTHFGWQFFIWCTHVVNFPGMNIPCNFAWPTWGRILGQQKYHELWERIVIHKFFFQRPRIAPRGRQDPPERPQEASKTA